MGLLILDGPRSEYEINGQYLGTARWEPTHIEKPEAGEVNNLWNWYIYSITEDGTLRLSDLDKAKNLVNEYRKWGEEYQIIEVASFANELQIGQFIGYDLSYGVGLSLLSWGLTFYNRLEKDPKKDKTRPITLLIERYFQPLLNDNGLFNDLETVKFLHEVLCAFQQFEPNAFESHLEEFKPIALGLIRDST